MATTYTAILNLALPTTGELSGTWGDTVNNSITELIEDAIAATATASVTGGDWTLSTTGGGVANEARCAILIPTGTPGVSRNVIAPSLSKAYIVVNQSDAEVVVKGAATTGVTVSSGSKALVAWNGADFIQVGVSVGGSTTQVQYNSSGSLAGSSSFTFNSGTGTVTATKFSGALDVTNSNLRLLGSSTGYTTFTSSNSGASNYTITIPTENMTMGFRDIPAVGAKTSSYVLATGDVGKYVEIGSGGSITIPDGVFSAGNAISLFNNTSGNVTITCTITTAYIAGANTDSATMTLATRGLATIFFNSGTVCVVSGNVS